MRGYIEVDSADKLEALQTRLNGFHDALIREIHAINREGEGPEDFDVRMLIHVPWLAFDVEAVFIALESGTFDAGWSSDHRSSFRDWGVPYYQIEFGGMRCRRLFYRYTERDCSRAGTGLGAEIPSPYAYEATTIHPGWRMCSECCNAWQVDEKVIFSRCPRCHLLTELAGEDEPE